MFLEKKLYRIIDKNDEVYQEKESDSFHNVIMDYCKAKNMEFKPATPCDWISLGLSFKNDLFSNQEDIEIFYGLLRSYGYRGEEDINDIIFNLSSLKKSHHDSKVIKRALISPYIDDIEHYKGEYRIISSGLGVIPFSLAIDLYRCNSLENYINSFQAHNNCHNNATFMSNIVPSGYSVTSLCKGYFSADYFHSYTIDDDFVIDLCLGAVIPKTDYYKLRSPKELNIIPNKDVEDRSYDLRRKVKNKKSYCDLLLLAAYQMYLERKNNIKNPILRMLK